MSQHGMRYALHERKKRKEKTTPFGVNSMRSQVLHRAAQDVLHDILFVWLSQMVSMPMHLS